MSKAAYHQRGETLDYTNTGASAIEAGTILTIGKRIGVAATLIQPKALGAVDVVGVFNMPKASTNAITMGTPVYFDETGITEAADNGKSDSGKKEYVLAGYAVADAAAEAKEILVKINA